MEQNIYGNISTVQQEMHKMHWRGNVPAEVYNFGMIHSDQERIIQDDPEGQGQRKQHCTLYCLATICVILVTAGVCGGAFMYTQNSDAIMNMEKQLASEVEKMKSQEKKTKEELLQNIQSSEAQNSEAIVNLEKQLASEVEKMKSQVAKTKEELLQNIQSSGADINSQVDKKINDLKKKLLSGCEENLSWTQFGDRWYSVSRCSGSWEKARQQCVAMDSTLAMVKTERQMEFLAGLAKDSRYWLGLNDLGSEGTWKWLDGSSAENSNGLWNPGEPNNSGEEDCGQMKNGRLNDEPCEMNLPWICERTRYHVKFRLM